MCVSSDNAKCFWFSVGRSLLDIGFKFVFLSDKSTEISVAGRGLEIVVAKGHAQQWNQQRNPAIKQYSCSEWELSPRHVETNKPFHFLPREKYIALEDCGAIPS
jgi:hypothetical protein